MGALAVSMRRVYPRFWARLYSPARHVMTLALRIMCIMVYQDSTIGILYYVH
jgi:hypothetical protein